MESFEYVGPGQCTICGEGKSRTLHRVDEATKRWDGETYCSHCAGETSPETKQTKFRMITWEQLRLMTTKGRARVVKHVVEVWKEGYIIRC